MNRRLISILTSVALLNLLTGCHSSREIPVHEFWEHSTKDIISVVIKSGEVIEFPQKNPAKFDSSRNAIIGLTTTGMDVEIPSDDIIWMKVRKVDTVKTGVFVVMGMAIIAGAIAGIVFIIVINSDFD